MVCVNKDCYNYDLMDSVGLTPSDYNFHPSLNITDLGTIVNDLSRDA